LSLGARGGRYAPFDLHEDSGREGAGLVLGGGDGDGDEFGGGERFGWGGGAESSAFALRDEVKRFDTPPPGGDESFGMGSWGAGAVDGAGGALRGVWGEDGELGMVDRDTMAGTGGRWDYEGGGWDVEEGLKQVGGGGGEGGEEGEEGQQWLRGDDATAGGDIDADEFGEGGEGGGGGEGGREEVDNQTESSEIEFA
jgi:hypothetical protein